MAGTGDGEPAGNARDAGESPAHPTPSPDGGSLDPADGDETPFRPDAEGNSPSVRGAEAVERAAGSAGDETVPRSTGPGAWTAVEEQVRLSEEPWWEAAGAPPPHPDARPWHARDAAGRGSTGAARSRESSGDLGKWFGTETRRRELLVGVLGLVALVLVVLTASAWLAAAFGGP